MFQGTNHCSVTESNTPVRFSGSSQTVNTTWSNLSRSVCERPLWKTAIIIIIIISASAPERCSPVTLFQFFAFCICSVIATLHTEEAVHKFIALYGH